MRKIDTIVIHCTATPEGKEFSLAQITAMHRARGFKTCGYHILVHLDGSVSIGRPDEMVGAHVAGFNATTLAASYVGGLSKSGQAKDTRTPAQKKTLIEVVKGNRCSAPTLAAAALSVIDIPWMSEKEFLHGDYVGGSHNPAEQA